MAKAVFQVELAPFDCAGCFKMMEDQLLVTKGIISVKTFPQLGRIRIEFKETMVGTEELEAMIENLGYSVESKKVT